MGFPEGAQIGIGRALTLVAEGGHPSIAKPLKGFGAGVFELALRFHTDAYRVVYAVQIGQEVWVLHAFQKKSKSGIKNPESGNGPDRRKTETAEGSLTMTDNHDDFELVRGSGNVFSDFNHPNAELEQLRSILAARIIKTLDAQNMTVRRAHELTGFAAADFSRVRRANLGRFTVDRLMTMLARLGDDVEVTITTRPAAPKAHPADLAPSPL